ncbi:hypothetical protein MTR_5g057080 [Medicago truncatula]|uniref:Uncharacterized protein n=1 Tax=Medicago truncatula TaxID=3880 RepID=G7K1N0_MEDTR|nr:hypothetical protein MTR_5g057080 [Medicago truncatula]
MLILQFKELSASLSINPNCCKFESKTAVLGKKRGFSYKVKAEEIATVKVGFERPNGVSDSKPTLIGSANNGNSTTPPEIAVTYKRGDIKSHDVAAQIAVK